MVASRTLFERDGPPGFHYRDDFITDSDERVLREAIANVAFADFEMRGVVARRRVAFFGQSYEWAAPGPLPAFLLPLRAQIAVCDARREGHVRGTEMIAKVGEESLAFPERRTGRPDGPCQVCPDSGRHGFWH